MGLKEELAEKLAGIDCKERISEILKENHEALYLNRKDKGMLDAVQEKVVSRKLLVFGVATGLLWWVGLDSDTWGMIAMCYIGGQTAVDFAKVWRGVQ